MSEFVMTGGDVFGRYCKIEMHRHVGPNEFYIHKCIGSHESNVWVDVPIHGNHKPRSHKEIAPVMTVITCGIDETQGFPVRACDVEMLPRADRTCRIEEVRRTDAPKVGPPLMRCSACGTESPWLSKEDRFCRFCGARVVDGDV